MSEQDKGLEVSRSQPCADASALAPTAAPRWMVQDRGGLIDWLRERAADLMLRSEDPKLGQFLRDSAWGASDAFYELAGLIEDGQWDPVRPVDPDTHHALVSTISNALSNGGEAVQLGNSGMNNPYGNQSHDQ